MSGSNPISGADAATHADEQKKIDEYVTSRRASVAKKTKEEADSLQQFVYNNANPNPVVVAFSIIGIIAGLWFLHILFLKPSISGKWSDSDDCIWDIHHNKFTNNISVKRVVRGTGKLSNAKFTETGCGVVMDNLFKYKNIIGVWNYSDVILFVDGGGLQRIYE